MPNLRKSKNCQPEFPSIHIDTSISRSATELQVGYYQVARRLYGNERGERVTPIIPERVTKIPLSMASSSSLSPSIHKYDNVFIYSGLSAE